MNKEISVGGTSSTLVALVWISGLSYSPDDRPSFAALVDSLRNIDWSASTSSNKLGHTMDILWVTRDGDEFPRKK